MKVLTGLSVLCRRKPSFLKSIRSTSCRLISLPNYLHVWYYLPTSSNQQPAMTPTTHPDPLIIPPLNDHKQTIILLHGRGSNAAKFGPSLLHHPITNIAANPEPTNDNNNNNSGTNIKTLATSFPNAKFIFPTASKKRAVAYNRAVIHQWFDNWPLAPADTIGDDEGTNAGAGAGVGAGAKPPQDKNKTKHNNNNNNNRNRDYLPIKGLRETVQFLHNLIREEASLVGSRNVVLGGLSQGGAAALITGLLWDPRPDDGGSDPGVVVGA